MYLDTTVVAGLIIVTLTCAVIGYVACFASRKIREDSLKNNA